MSEEEEANDGDEDQNEEEEQEDQENEDEDDEDEEDEDQNSEEEDSDQQEQSDQEDGQEENEEPQDSGGKEEQGEQEDNEHHLPEFRRVEQEFKFPNILAELASLSTSVDSLIETFPSHAAGTAYRYMSQQSAAHNPYLASTTNNHIATENSRAQTGQAAYSPRVVVMKDEDIQVSMQPQIIIQPTRIEKQPSLPSYKISNQSNRFLAELYEENKKLKRWQNSSYQPYSSGLVKTLAGSQGQNKFQRRPYQKGLFNVEERNRQIDQAIQLLRKQEQELGQ